MSFYVRALKLMEDKSKRKAIELIESGSEIAGSAVGGAVGFFAGGPAGAAGAAALGSTLGKAISDFANRHLSRKQEVRVGACAAIAINSIKEMENSGLKLRDDGFFEESNDRQSDAEEIFDGVLLHSKNEHEEKKIKHLGIFYAKIAYSPGVSKSEANHLLNLSNSLTYRKMCILSILMKINSGENLGLLDRNYRGREEPIPYETVSLLQEIVELHSQGLIAEIMSDKGYTINSGWSDITPNSQGLRPLGFRLATLLGVDQIPRSDIDPIVEQLSQDY